jgi:Ca2+-dependent lipid-binding protein
MENEKYLNKLQRRGERKEKEEVSEMKRLMEETKKEMGVNPEVRSKKELKRKLTKEKRKKKKDIKQQKIERKEDMKEVQAMEKIKKICKKGTKYLWNNHKVFLIFCLLSLIFFILGYDYIAYVLIFYYGAILYYRLIWSLI